MNASFIQKPIMRRLSRQETGELCLDIISALGGSSDPFAGAVYTLDMGPCLALAQQASELFSRKITFTHVLNKMLAVAITENPVYNRVVLGGHVYEMQGVYISNAFNLPGKELAVTYFILENSHLKTLAEIQQEAIMKMVEKTRANARPKKRILRELQRLYFRLRLYCLVPERVSCEVGLRSGLISNVVLSTHDYGGPSNFMVVKPLISRVKMPLRIHASAMGRQPCIAADGSVSACETLHLTVIADHRITYGVHAHRFGQSLQRICAEPEKYLL